MSGNQFADLPPHDRAAEQCALGGMMLSEPALADVAAVLESEDFFVPAHQIVFETIMGLAAEGKPVDAITVSARLAETGQLAKAGGGPGLHTLIAAVPTAANAGYYAQIVREKSIDRHMIIAGTQIEQAGWSGGDREDRIEYAYRVLDVAAGRVAPARARPLGELLAPALDRIEAGPGARRGVALGWPALDSLLGGARPGQFLVVASRPAVGKTVVLLNAAAYAAQAGVPVLLCSLEQPADEIIERVLAAEAGVDLTAIRGGNMPDEAWKRIADVHGKLAEAPLMVNDDPGIRLAGVRSDLRAMARAGTPAGLMILDYMQLVAGAGKADNREREVAELSRGLKLLAKEHNLPVIAGAQLNRGPELRADHRPLLADLRDSGSVEQDADVVVLLYRAAMYDESAGNDMDVIVAKNRSGPTGTVELTFRGHFARVDSIEWSASLSLEKMPEGLPTDDARDI